MWNFHTHLLLLENIFHFSGGFISFSVISTMDFNRLLRNQNIGNPYNFPLFVHHPSTNSLDSYSMQFVRDIALQFAAFEIHVRNRGVLNRTVFPIVINCMLLPKAACGSLFGKDIAGGFQVQSVLSLSFHAWFVRNYEVAQQLNSVFAGWLLKLFAFTEASNWSKMLNITTFDRLLKLTLPVNK